MKKIMKIPEHSEKKIKEIEEDFDKEEGWIKADEEFGEDRESQISLYNR